MIAKRQTPRRGGSRYHIVKLGRYCQDASHQGEKCLMSWFAGCDAQDYDWALQEIAVTQELNKRVKQDKTYHLVVSFRPEDEARLTPDAYKKIEEAFADGLGLSEHQRVCGVHKNTAHIHMHVAYNLIHPDRLTVATTLFRDYAKLSAVCRAMEKEFGLVVDNGYEQAKNRQTPAISQHAASMESHSGETSFQSHALPLKDTLLDKLETAKTWQDAQNILAGYGMKLQPKSGGLVVVNLDGKGAVKASTLGLSKVKLEKRFGKFETEAHNAKENKEIPATEATGTGKEASPLLAHRTEIVQKLDTAQNWQDVHQILAGYGLAIKTRGNGLVLAKGKGKASVTIKASELDRGMSKKALESRFGPYTASETAYTPKPRQPRSQERDELYKAYQAALAEKIARIDAEKARNDASYNWIKEKKQQQQATLYASTYSRRTRGARLRIVLNSYRQALAKEKADHKAALAEIMQDYQWYNWNTYLQDQAKKGNATALSVLRSMEERKAQQVAQQQSQQPQQEAGKKEPAQSQEQPQTRAETAEAGKVEAMPETGNPTPAPPKQDGKLAVERAPGQRLSRLVEIETMRVKLGGASKAYFPGSSYRIDNRGVVIIQLASGGTIRDAGNKLHFSREAETIQAARLYAQSKFGKSIREKENSIERRESIGKKLTRIFKPHLGILRDCARNGVRSLSQLTLVGNRNKQEKTSVLLSSHAHDDLER